MRLWENAIKEIKAADRRVITTRWEKTFWERTAEKMG
jgi:hypothetical protein